jgi:hypothetical protein
MGRHYDHAGDGYAIRAIDSLSKMPDGLYRSKSMMVTTDGNELVITRSRKTSTMTITAVEDSRVAFRNLNNGFYLDHYFAMSDEVNKLYPLNHHSFRNGYYTWDSLENKDIDYQQFRNFALQHIGSIRDSIKTINDQYVALTNYLVENLPTMQYDVLRDSIMKLPTGFKPYSKYFGKIVTQVALLKPDYFLRLAEEDPANRDFIFREVMDDDETAESLKRVDGRSEIKKEFFNQRKESKTFPYRVFGMYAIFIGLLALLIASQ